MGEDRWRTKDRSRFHFIPLIVRVRICSLRRDEIPRDLKVDLQKLEAWDFLLVSDGLDNDVGTIVKIAVSR